MFGGKNVVNHVDLDNTSDNLLYEHQLARFVVSLTELEYRIKELEVKVNLRLNNCLSKGAIIILILLYNITVIQYYLHVRLKTSVILLTTTNLF
jgi:hypothetical protein